VTTETLWIVVAVVVAVLLIAVALGLVLRRQRRISLREPGQLEREPGTDTAPPRQGGTYKAESGFNFSSGTAAPPRPADRPAQRTAPPATPPAVPPAPQARPDTPRPVAPEPSGAHRGTPPADTLAPGREASAAETQAPERPAPPAPDVPKIVAPETATREATVAPETVAPTTAPPQPVAPEATAPPTSVPERAVPDTAAPETAAPDTAAPDTAVPETVPDTAVPDTAVPDTAAPERVAPEAPIQETAAPPDTAPSRPTLPTTPYPPAAPPPDEPRSTNGSAPTATPPAPPSAAPPVTPPVAPAPPAPPELPTPPETRAPAAPTEVIEPVEGRIERLRGRLARSRSGFGQGLLGLLGAGELDEESWEDVEAMLLQADLGPEMTAELVDTLRVELARRAVRTPAQARQLLRDVLTDALRPELDRSVRALPHDGRPAVLLVVGVNGTGKTTTTGKLARVLVAGGRHVVLGAADTFRAAAAEQLGTWGERAGATTIRGPEGADPASVAFDAVKQGADEGADAVLLDTAGRLHTKTGLMDELGKVKRVVSRQAEVDEVLLVLDATTGQNGLTQARVFGDVVDVSGIVLTKLDGTAKGGIVFRVQRELGVPVKLVGLGEGPDDLAPFEPAAFVDALLT
jgi:fused signal recognition particle receptor